MLARLKLFFYLFLISSITLTVFGVLKVASSNVIGSTFTTLYPISDAYVDESTPDINYGTNTRLVTKFNSHLCFAYIMFDLSSIEPNATLLYAELNVYASSGSWSGPWGSAGVGAHFSSDTTWKEDEITWNNKPSFEIEATDKCGFGMVASEGYKSWNVTKDVKAAFSSGKLTEVLNFAYGEHGELNFCSREHRNTPMLIVEYTTKPIYSIHVESIQDTGNTTNLGHVIISEKFFTIPNSVSAVPRSYNISYKCGYKFVRWETEGGVTVSDFNNQPQF